MTNPSLLDPQAFPPSPFCELVGLETLEVSAEKSVTALTLGPQHANAFGTAHGGAIFALADRAFGLAQNVDGVTRLAMDMSIRFLRPALVGQRLTATARRVQQGRQTAFYRIDVEDESGRLIACLSGTGHIFEKR
jgi:acyl-CoA thioesterase